MRQKKYHVFSITWDENQIRSYVDNQAYFTIDITPSTLSEFHQEHFFICRHSADCLLPGLLANQNSGGIQERARCVHPNAIDSGISYVAFAVRPGDEITGFVGGHDWCCSRARCWSIG